MRCCDGKCKRIHITSDHEICGYNEGRGPCCKGYECCNDECVTHAPTKIPTKIPTEIPTEMPTEMPTKIPTEIPVRSPTDDDQNAEFAAVLNANNLNDGNNEKNDEYEYKIGFSDETQVILLVMIIIGIAIISASGYYFCYRNTKTMESGYSVNEMS
eukprot:490289_1